jgi:glycosyltransferase involved in cell wall biosynthesis
VEIFTVPFFYLPFKNIYLKAGKRHARKAIEVIEKSNLKFDLIHAHFAWSAGYAAVKVKEKYNKPLVITGHGYDIYKLPLRSERFKNEIVKVFNSTDQVLTVSDENNKHLKGMGVKNVKVFPNGYATNIFYYKDKQECCEKLQLPINKKIILTIGNLEEIKGYEYLIKALEMVRQKDSNFLCLHIGAGSLEGRLRKMVKEKGLESHIQFLGRQPHNELVDYFGASDFFVSSSLAEGNPTVMFESLGCGKPFIGTKVGGVPEIISSEDYGLLCDSGDEKALAENILKALDKDWNTEKILSYAEEFSWENICKNIEGVYKDLL